MTDGDNKREWRRYKAEVEHGRTRDCDLRVGIAATITVEPLEPYLGADLLRKDFKPRISIGPFNQLWQVCADHEATLGGSDLNVIVLLWRLEDMFPDLLAKCVQAREALSDLLREVSRLVDAVHLLRTTFGGTLIVSTPPYPSVPGFDVLGFGQHVPGMPVFNAVSQYWTDEIAKVGRVRLFDLQGLLLKVGIDQAQDSRKWLLYRQPYTEEFWLAIGTMLGRMIAAEKTSPKKCIVLDLDNTLWGGILGEDGVEGIQLGDEFPGKAYSDFQRYLLHLKQRGVLLAIASKNNAEDAFEVFDKHDAMILSREDISVFEIHWDSKVESIKRVAQRLSIGVDSLVFVDDNPKELGEVKERLPQVSCLMVPDELACLPGLLSNTDLFDVAEVTDEDRRRTEMMAADAIRQQSQERMSEDEFRKCLNLEIEVFKVEKQHLTRVTQLINKTNQFNLTTIRRTQDEVEALARSNGTLVLGMHAKDRYGDYGLVGVAILRKEDRTCVIDTLLMSCRVLGRGAEDAFISELSQAARALGCDELRGTYIATAKNGMVKDLYAHFNFGRCAGGNEWILNCKNGPAITGGARDQIVEK